MPSYSYIQDTVNAGEVPGREIDATLLRYPYFIQLGADKHHLVPGMLQQETRPKVGEWLQAGMVDRDLPGRYFVQYTDFNTLVPGSLIKGTRFPPGKWKEVKRVPDPPEIDSIFHHVHFTEGYEGTIDPEGPYNFLSTFHFFPDVFYPVLDHYFPGLRDAGIVYCDMYYFKGTYQELGEDVTKLVPFSQPDSFLRIRFDFDGSPLFTINTTQLGVDSMLIMPTAEVGNYCFIIVPQGGIDYIVLEDVLTVVE